MDFHPQRHTKPEKIPWIIMCKGFRLSEISSQLKQVKPPTINWWSPQPSTGEAPNHQLVKPPTINWWSPQPSTGEAPNHQLVKPPTINWWSPQPSSGEAPNHQLVKPPTINLDHRKDVRLRTTFAATDSGGIEGSNFLRGVKNGGIGNGGMRSSSQMTKSW